MLLIYVYCPQARLEPSLGCFLLLLLYRRYGDDQNFLHHSLCHFDPAGPRIDKKEVTLGKWEPEERKY